MAFHFLEDFSQYNEKNHPYKINVEKVSIYSHNHGGILEDGFYHILMDGNYHDLATPLLRDFELKLDFELTYLKAEFGVGVVVVFRRDVPSKKGHELQFVWDQKHILHFILDGKDIFTRQDEALPDFKKVENGTLVLKVEGNKGNVKIFNEDVSFDIPEDASMPEKGKIGFNMTFAPSEILILKHIELTSPDEAEKKEFARHKFRIGCVQGFDTPIDYEVVLSRYSTGEVHCQGVLSGTVMDRGERIETGGGEWGRISEKLTSPYIRIEENGKVYENIYFYNGTKLLYDRKMNVLYSGKEIPWPFTFDIVFPDFPQDYILAAGYEYAINTPFRFVENGPYEQIRDKEGNLIFEGNSLYKNSAALTFRSPEDKKIVSMIPSDIPRRDKALKFAKEQHYFYDDEKVVFYIEEYFRKKELSSDELSIQCSFTSCYDEALDDGSFTIEKVESKDLAGDIGKVIFKVTLNKTPSVGVWHMYTSLMAGSMLLCKEKTIFDVLNTDPNGLGPIEASRLPKIFSMPNETKYIETSAFDPWSEYGGCAHYYYGGTWLPAVGAAYEVQDLVKIYQRKWFVWSFSRNCNDFDMHSAFNQNLIRKADFFGGVPHDVSYASRYDFGSNGFCKKELLQIIRDFVAEKKPALKIVTLELIDKYLAEGTALANEEIKDITETCWDELIDYAHPIIEKSTQDFVDYLYSLKPDAARASYGPCPIYAQKYKTAYMLRHVSAPIEKDPRIRKNGSFWFMEDYHFSCDYPLCRPALYVSSYDYYYSYSRYMYPEIYYTGWGRCHDGAVYQAHPIPTTELAPEHQRRIVYEFTYGTPQYKNGFYKYWTDYGFHCRNAEKRSLEEFIYAWGKMIRNEPKKAPRSPFMLLDLEQIRRRKDYYEEECSFHVEGIGFSFDSADVCNTAEEALAYTFERNSNDGRITPVITDFTQLDSITKDMAEYLILPPIVEGTPKSIIDSIRKAAERGINLLCFEEVCGLEDLFGVEKDPAGFRKLGHLDGEDFSHKLCGTKYIGKDAACILYGAEAAGKEMDREVIFAKENANGTRCVFINVPPTVVRRATFRSNYNHGQDALSTNMRAKMKEIFAYLAPEPAFKASRGCLLSSYNEKGELVVVLSDDSPIYHDDAVYPAKVKVTINLAGIGEKEITSDAEEFSILSRSRDRLVLLTKTAKDTALFFKFV